MRKRNYLQQAQGSIIGLLCLFCSACSVLADLAPVKEEVVQVQDWLIVPIFYATNRERANIEQIDFTEKQNNGKLLFGLKNVIVPRPDNISKEIIDSMGWRLLHLDNPIPSDKRPSMPDDKEFKVKDQELAVKEVVVAFDKYRKDIGIKEAAIFVHGCCATFKTNMERAAKLTVQLQMPVVVYDWVSPIGFSHYLENETLAQETYDGFCKFLDHVSKYIPSKQTIVIGHSMGAAFVDEAFVRRYERFADGKTIDKYHAIIFSQPDLDATVYINHNKRIASQAEKTRIFFVMDDPRLKVSATVHGGLDRLGKPGKLLDKLLQVENQDLIDMTVTGIGHNLPAKYIADVEKTGTLNDRVYKLIEKSPHLFVMEKTSQIAADKQ